MAGAGARWNRTFRKILNIRFGPGAAKLPPGITRIHMEFPAADTKSGNGACNKFWKECLPRLKFHNPAIPMIVNRDPGEEPHSQITLYFKNKDAVRPEGARDVKQRDQPSSSAIAESKAQPPDWDERVVKMELDKLPYEFIVQKFMTATGAEQVLPNEEDQESMRIMKQLEDHYAELDEKSRANNPNPFKNKAEWEKEKENAMPLAQ